MSQQRDILWFRSLVMICLLAIVWFLGRPLVELMLERFERTAMQQVVRQLNAACEGMLIRARLDSRIDLADWIGANPVDCLSEQGLSSWRYVGELTDAELQPEASWGFDPVMGALVYRWRHEEQLINQDPKKDLIRWALVADFADTDQNGVLDKGEVITGLYLKPLYEFRWR